MNGTLTEQEMADFKQYQEWKRSQQDRLTAGPDEWTERDPNSGTQSILSFVRDTVCQAVTVTSQEMTDAPDPNQNSVKAGVFLSHFRKQVGIVGDRIMQAVRKSYGPEVHTRGWMKWPEVRKELVAVFREAANMLEEIDTPNTQTGGIGTLLNEAVIQMPVATGINPPTIVIPTNAELAG